jgi:hypothetical protein
VEVSFIGGGNRRKPLICCKSLHDKHYHIILYRVHLAQAGLKLTTLVVMGTDLKELGRFLYTGFPLAIFLQAVCTIGLNLVVGHHFSNISSYLNLSVHIQCILW